MAARETAEERKAAALERMANSAERAVELLGHVVELLGRGVDLADRAAYPAVIDRALRALTRAATPRQVAGVYRRASLLVGPGERDVLFSECLKVAAACVGASAFEDNAPSPGFAASFRALCDAPRRPVRPVPTGSRSPK